MGGMPAELRVSATETILEFFVASFLFRRKPAQDLTARRDGHRSCNLPATAYVEGDRLLGGMGRAGQNWDWFLLLGIA